MEQLNKRMEINGISKTFFSDKGYFTAIKDVSFDVNDGEFLVILGPGRCGKTVLLNIIAGLEQQTGGTVVYNGREWKGVNPEISMVFQKLALMPFKTVMENVELGLKFRGMSKGQRRELAQHYIELVGLKGFEKSYPTQLSGGMKQRVGIARAYAADPKLLIMDEPFGCPDPVPDAGGNLKNLGKGKAYRHIRHQQYRGSLLSGRQNYPSQRLPGHCKGGISHQYTEAKGYGKRGIPEAAYGYFRQH